MEQFAILELLPNLHSARVERESKDLTWISYPGVRGNIAIRMIKGSGNYVPRTVAMVCHVYRLRRIYWCFPINVIIKANTTKGHGVT